MSFAKITGPGLAALAFSVAALWGCLICERVIVRQAERERARVLRDLGRLQRQVPRPVSAPSPVFRRGLRASAG
jgi:hypothetical protein